MRPFVFYFALSIAAAGVRAPGLILQSQPPEQQAVRPKLSETEVSRLRARAEEGDTAAQFSLGKAYEDGNGVPQNDELAVKWVRKAADQGNALAQNELGLIYRLGLGVSRDKEEAVRWYHKSAKQGNPQAMFNLGVSYYNGDGVPSNSDLAYAWFLLAQQAGNPMADEAVERSAKEGGRRGTPDAFQQVAAMYEKGEELPQSYSEAAEWYRKAADLSPKAAVKLASMLIDANGVPSDYGQAMELCKNAAKSNYSPGQFCVGFLYRKGLGTPANPNEAFKWYTEASKEGQGLPQATMGLAEMYWKGEGVGVNRSEAYYLFFLASRKGQPNAKTQAQKLWTEMSHEDHKILEKKLRRLRLDPQKVISFMSDPQAPDPLR